MESSLVCTQFVDICWITITTSPMDRRQDSNAASTSTGKRGPSAQDHDRSTVPDVSKEAHRNGVAVEKNRDKSSNQDSYVTCIDVHCFS